MSADSIQPGHGIVKRVGWEKDRATGENEFIAVIVFPNGAPPELSFSIVWDAIPVKVIPANEGKS